MANVVKLDFVPDKFEPNGLLLRTDNNKLYVNTGTLENPDFELVGGRIPSGTIQMFAGLSAAIPAGWLRCNGLTFNTSLYPELFAAIRYQWGGAGSSFQVPNLEQNNLFVRAANGDGEVGNTGGESLHTLNSDEMPNHTHAPIGGQHLHTAAASNSNGSSTDVFRRGGGTAGSIRVRSNVTGLGIGSAGGSEPHENKPPYVSVYYMIKT